MICTKRSWPAPTSLSTTKSYGGRDVRERLFSDFSGKCYLCEGPVDLSSLEIDHRKQKAQFPAETLSWENLFCCCRQCNGARKKAYPNGGLLDPDKHDVERLVRQRFDGDNHFCFQAKDLSDQAAINTADELKLVHVGTGRGDLRARDLQGAIKDMLLRAHHWQVELTRLAAQQKRGTDAWQKAEGELRRLVSRKSPYTMLVRSRFKTCPLTRPLFD